MEHVLVDVFVYLVSQNLLTFSGTRVSHIHFETVLMSVEGKHGQFVGIGCEMNARNVSVFFQREFQCTDYAAFDVERLYAYGGVFRTGHRVFIFVSARIFRILIFGRDDYPCTTGMRTRVLRFHRT